MPMMRGQFRKGHAAMSAASAGRRATREAGHRLEIVGRLGDLAFPALCASCGAKAAATLVIARAFHRLEGDDWIDVVDKVKVPFCSRCVTQHEHEDALHPIEPALRPPRWSAYLVPGIYAWLGLFLLLRVALDLVGRSMLGGLVAAGGGGLCLLGSCVGAVRSWRVPEHERVRPETSVMQAFGFTTELNDLMEPPRRAYFLANATFAGAFGQLNGERSWDAHGPAAKRAELKWKIAICSVVLLVVLAWIVSTVFGIPGD
jgi:hypothetical protein